tara:strand:- start:1321 stop:1635 length:315 start_codon:yes stop_codon:yes gene_type:complete
MVTIGDPRAKTRETGEWWRGLSAEDRVSAITDVIGDALIRVISASPNGRIILETADHSAAKIGNLLRLSEHKCRKLDDGIRLYRKQAPDTNALRRLRGVVVNED